MRLLKAEKKKDSITYALNAVQLKDNQYELAVLHFVESLQAKNEYKSLAPHQTVKALLQQTQIAEQHHCRNVYRLHDELAKYAYLNALSFGNYTESKKYVQQYIDHTLTSSTPACDNGITIFVVWLPSAIKTSVILKNTTH